MWLGRMRLGHQKIRKLDCSFGFARIGHSIAACHFSELRLLVAKGVLQGAELAAWAVAAGLGFAPSALAPGPRPSWAACHATLSRNRASLPPHDGAHILAIRSKRSAISFPVTCGRSLCAFATRASHVFKFEPAGSDELAQPICCLSAKLGFGLTRSVADFGGIETNEPDVGLFGMN